MGQFGEVKPPVPFTIQVDLRKIHNGDTKVMRTNNSHNPQISTYDARCETAITWDLMARVI